MSTASGSCRRTATSCPSPSASARTACRSTASAPPRRRCPSSRPAPASSTSARWRSTTTSELEQPTHGKGQRPVDTELLQVLGSAYKASKRDEEGYTPLSELGQRAKAVSSFAARNYGYTRLSDLIKAVPNFEVKSGRRRPPAGQAPALSAVDRTTRLLPARPQRRKLFRRRGGTERLARHGCDG